MASFASWSFRRMSSLVGLNCFLLGAYDALSLVGLLVPVREIHIKQFVRHLKECNLENRIIFLLNSRGISTDLYIRDKCSKGSTINVAEPLKIFFSLWEMQIATKFEKKNVYNIQMHSFVLALQWYRRCVTLGCDGRHSSHRQGRQDGYITCRNCKKYNHETSIQK